MSFPLEANSVSDSFKPLVTIVIPVYNGADFLADSIQSALAQTYEATEIIVVNDGSNDGGATERISHSFGHAIRYFSKSNGGVASALNLAIREMSGDYFSWLSHDDLYVKDKIAQQIAFLSVHGTSRTIIYSDYSIFTDDRVADSVPVLMSEVRPECFRYWITAESVLHGCSLLIPRSAFDAAGAFNESLRTTQDYELWFRMAASHRFIHIPQVLIAARSHANQDTNKIADVAFEEAGRLYLGFVKALEPSEIPGNTPLEIGASYLRLASSLWQRGFDDAAAYCEAMAREYGASFAQVLGAQLIAYSARGVRRFARTLFSPQARQSIRRFFARMWTSH
ncbi:glycosyltransferase [Pseudomonas chlororaphis]|uniref:glycosyltransferase n=1 Tax=Pseudomonas chlororaphis TaxID=587753 RepID=UPI0013DDAA8C|nr:glycosyltransferase [Pseudomonas chlororaphis]